MTAAMTEDDRITAEDVAFLNRQAVARAGAFGRLSGTGLVAVGAVAALAWLWFTIRQQQMMDDGAGGSDPFGSAPEVTFADRLDMFTNGISLLVFAGLAAGGGLGLRLLADYTVARVGGSLTGFEPGDQAPAPLESEPDSDDKPESED
jgi:hypothetical protein